MKTRGMLLASAAATLFAAAGAAPAGAGSHEAGEMVECHGVNSCKGQSACQTAESECSGQNSCKGKGFLKLTQEECERAKAEMEGGMEGHEG